MFIEQAKSKLPPRKQGREAEYEGIVVSYTIIILEVWVIAVSGDSYVDQGMLHNC